MSVSAEGYATPAASGGNLHVHHSHSVQRLRSRVLHGGRHRINLNGCGHSRRRAIRHCRAGTRQRALFGAGTQDDRVASCGTRMPAARRAAAGRRQPATGAHGRRWATVRHRHRASPGLVIRRRQRRAAAVRSVRHPRPGRLRLRGPAPRHRSRGLPAGCSTSKTRNAPPCPTCAASAPSAATTR